MRARVGVGLVRLNTQRMRECGNVVNVAKNKKKGRHSA